jgi:hypothetical protein
MKTAIESTALIRDFQGVAGTVESVDFTRFSPFGDHSAQVRARFRRNSVGTREEASF